MRIGKKCVNNISEAIEKLVYYTECPTFTNYTITTIKKQ